ncbi:MAG: hypothetical protein PHY95_04490 [Candidatus ainarchaeum sp.]|nr:hypothetical protein [Candidatus ainarchaeum sp.]
MATATPKGHRHQTEGEPREEPKPPKKYSRREFLRVARDLAVVGIGAKVLGSTPSKADEGQERPARVAQAPVQPQVRGSTSGTRRITGSNPTDRVYEIPTTAQPEPLTGEEVREEYGYMFENRDATIMDLPTSGRVTMGDWEVEVIPSRLGILDVTVRNASLNYERDTVLLRESRLVLLPFPETDYAKGPLFATVNSAGVNVYFYNKVSGCVTDHLFAYASQMPGNETPDVGTDVYNNRPYVVVVPAGSRTANKDLLPGTRIFQYALGTTEQDGNGPAANMAYLVRGND